MKRSTRTILILLAVILVVILAGPLLVPIPPLQGTVPPQELADRDSQFVEINNISLHYKIMGQGEPVFILLHGFGASLFSWQAVMQPFSRYGTVIAYDRPAFGLTERPVAWTGMNPYSSESNLALLLGLMNHLGIRSAILVGNSAGGKLAMQFAQAHPDRTQALILVDPAIYTGGGAPSWVRYLFYTPQMQHLGPLFVRSIQRSGTDLLRTAWHDPSKITPAIWEGYTRPLKADNWDKALWFFTTASNNMDPISLGDNIGVPVLVITGDDDRIVPTADSIKLAAELPNARLVIIEEAGHVPHEEQPIAFMQAVDEFLNTIK